MRSRFNRAYSILYGVSMCTLHSGEETKASASRLGFGCGCNESKAVIKRSILISSSGSRRKEPNDTAPLVWECQVCRLTIPSQYTVGIGMWSVAGQSLGSAKPHILNRGEFPAFVFTTRASIGIIRLGVTCIGDESLMLVM